MDTLIYLYSLLIRFYPLEYREKYGPQMLDTFRLLMQECHTKRDALLLCIKTIGDYVYSIFREYVSYTINSPLRKGLASTSMILMLPAIALITAGIINQRVQGPTISLLVQHNGIPVSHVLIITFVILPLMACLLQILMIAHTVPQIHSQKPFLVFAQQNIISFGIIFVAMSVVGMLFLHDVIGCSLSVFTHGINAARICLITH